MWTFAKVRSDSAQVFDEHGQHIAYVAVNERADTECEAQALAVLVTAAPDLLAACEGMEAATSTSDWHDAMRNVRAAIRRAKGEATWT